MRLIRLPAVLAALAAVLLFAATLGAHPMPRSLVLLDFHERGVAAELRLPLDRLEIGFGRPLVADPAAAFARLRGELAAYVAAHVSAASPDGRPWRVEVRELALGPEAPAHELVARLWLEPPPGASTRRLTLRDDVILHQLVTHVILVSVRSDWNGGVVSTQPELIGTFEHGAPLLEIDRAPGSAWRGFVSVVRLGMHHIADGTDHLLFLLVLLLPASLCVAGRRWGEYAGARRSAAHLVRIVTAFTVGHSLTLAAGAIGWLRAPSDPVEILIALSILVSALHALRPIFPGREAIVAAGFGLVHGLAFATVVAEIRLDAWHTTLAIFGFNLGIEIMQLAIVLVTVPWLLLLARVRVYTPIRLVGAAAAGVAALGWIGERALGLANPIGPVIERAAAQGLWLIATLAVLAILATVLTSQRLLPAPRSASTLRYPPAESEA